MLDFWVTFLVVCQVGQWIGAFLCLSVNMFKTKRSFFVALVPGYFVVWGFKVCYNIYKDFVKLARENFSKLPE